MILKVILKSNKMQSYFVVFCPNIVENIYDAMKTDSKLCINPDLVGLRSNNINMCIPTHRDIFNLINTTYNLNSRNFLMFKTEHILDTTPQFVRDIISKYDNKNGFYNCVLDVHDYKNKITIMVYE